MRFISADWIHTGEGTVMEKGVVAFDDRGMIHHVLSDRSDPLIPAERLELMEGLICPGFVNAHCHLELSHLCGKLTPGTGLPRFLVGVTQSRKSDPSEIYAAMLKADEQMLTNGIVLVGDISNGTDSIKAKQNSKIKYHTFVELIGLEEGKSEEKLDLAKQVRAQFSSAGLSASISPHAPYSLSDKLRKLLADENANESRSISIHNQETPSENELFETRAGRLTETFEGFGLSLRGLVQTGQTSLRSVFQDLNSQGPLVLVHNSHTTSEEMGWAIDNRKDLFWCSCPAANVFIELRNPKVEEWIELGATVCIGTDSLASNYQLSILNELELIQTRSPSLTIAQLITMATSNGARALGFGQEFGKLIQGARPGILNLTGRDISRGRITTNLAINRLD